MLNFNFLWRYLKEAGDIREDSNNEQETVVQTSVTSVLSVSEVSPTIVTNIELDASKSLNLASKLIRQEEIRQCYLVKRSGEATKHTSEEEVAT